MGSVRGISAGLLLVLAANLAGAADDEESDKKALQGTWDIVSLERSGSEVKPQKGTAMVVTGDKFVIRAGERVLAAGTFKLDTSKSPKVSEMTYTEGLATEKGKTFKGIYRLEKDRWTFCRGRSPDQGPPAEFKTTPDSGGFLVVYEKRAER
jgi:uncharacterized protein (TIGR03067 family)